MGTAGAKAVSAALDRASKAALVAFTAFALASHGAAARIDASTPEAAAPWTSLDANDAAEDFHFVIVGDRTGGMREGVFKSAIPKVNLLAPAFVLSIGDLIGGYTEDQAQLDQEWDEFEGLVAGLDAPFFYVPGNHDMNNTVMAKTWQTRFGPSYYRFVYKDVLFLVLNSELFGMLIEPDRPVPGPWTQAEQLAFVEQTLAEFPAPRWTIVLIHRPLWHYANAPQNDWLLVEEMLGERDYTVFAGHRHRYRKDLRKDRKYIVLATTGGSSQLRGGAYGEFDHVAWVTMTASGPRIANLMLDGIEDEDILAGPPRQADLNALRGSILGRRLVRSLPLFGEMDASPAGPVFERATVSFEAENTSAKRLILRYTVDAGPHMRYAGAPRKLVLKPGAVERIDVPLLAASSPRPLAGLTPGRIEWTLETNSHPYAVRLEFANALLPVSPFVMPSGIANVDGDLGEWPELPFKVLRQGDVGVKPTTATDASFVFGLRESDGDIYLAARVTDDRIVASTALTARIQDHLLVFVDARPEPERSSNAVLGLASRRGHLKRIAHARMTVVEAAWEEDLAELADSLAAVDWRTTRTPSGYVAEAKVSGTFLDNQAGEAWRTVRISLAVFDRDEDEITDPSWRGYKLHWQPDRFGPAPAAGTGTFVRSP